MQLLTNTFFKNTLHNRQIFQETGKNSIRIGFQGFTTRNILGIIPKKQENKANKAKTD
tara:strand:- start:1855 stop:2028 length:174 start_codon:yes stop_codon:yes gene_type:complete